MDVWAEGYSRQNEAAVNQGGGCWNEVKGWKRKGEL
jgi:hypothetical protein